jgi:pyridoxamine 5'-phosphate oxidase
LLGCGFVFADPPQDLYKAGNALYAEGKFADAAGKYQAAADTGFKNWVLEYNLGNACYRAGQLGKAILYYERAFRMNSGQGDVIYNLNLAATKAGEPELPSTALPALAWRLFYLLPINHLTLLATLLFIFICVAGGFALAGRNFLTGDLALGLGALFIVLSGWLGARIYSLEKPIGVVVTNVAEVRSGPNITYPANFTVPEGRRVLILEEQEAKRAKTIADATAVCLSTVDGKGEPDARMVLLKSYDERGFVFYTNLHSVKGKQLEKHPSAALTFYWDALQKQVRIQGKTEIVSEEEADAYWRTRARLSQLGAWASKQSEPLSSRTILIKDAAKLALQYGVRPVPRPPWWTGVRVIPRKIEFWHGRLNRLHDRFLYTKTSQGWSVNRLYP